VLLSVVDHYNRVLGDVRMESKKRVVGILLGTKSKGVLDITNSYAVPFEEDSKDPNVWFLDHNYHEDMFAMFKKVQAKEKVVGWYSTGPKIRPPDLEINELIRKYTADPVLVIIDVNPKDDLEIPTEAYRAVEASPDEQSSSKRTFEHLPSDIGAYEAEEVGVEHLLRNIRDTLVSTVGDEVQAQLASLKGLKKRMEEIAHYLDKVAQGKLPVNDKITYNIQNIINLRPDLRMKELITAFNTMTNDNMLVIYVSSLIRSILALHDLINNKLENREYERRKMIEDGEISDDEESENAKKKKKEEEGSNGKDKEEPGKEKEKASSQKHKGK
jgi:26S proteasome regulatory subunit N8